MKKKLIRITTLVLTLSLLALACSLSNQLAPANQGSSSVTRTGTPEGTTPPGETNGVQSPLTVGLDGLKAYQAVLKIDFRRHSGGKAGKRKPDLYPDRICCARRPPAVHRCGWRPGQKYTGWPPGWGLGRRGVFTPGPGGTLLSRDSRSQPARQSGA